MRQAFLILLTALSIQSSCLEAPVFAGPARFWVSPSDTNPYWNGASASDILHVDLFADPGQDASKDRLYIWAQPATIAPGVYKQLQNFTLDIVSKDSLIDFLDGPGLYGATIENPGGRFSSIRDSQQSYDHNPALELKTKTPSQIIVDGPDEIIGLQGLNLTVPVPNVINEGIGPNCDNGEEQGCVVTPQGPVWRVGSFGLQSLGTQGVADIHLQIGSAGMNHLSDNGDLNEPTSATQVIFSATGAGPVYDAGRFDHRQEMLVGDNPEVRVSISDNLVGDYDEDTIVSGSDYLLWQWELGSSTLLPNRRSGVTGPVGQADFQAWHTNYGESISGGSTTLVVPEPRSLVLACIALVLCHFCRSANGSTGLGKNQLQSRSRVAAFFSRFGSSKLPTGIWCDRCGPKWCW